MQLAKVKLLAQQQKQQMWVRLYDWEKLMTSSWKILDFANVKAFGEVV